jgi:hypothetical protein
MKKGMAVAAAALLLSGGCAHMGGGSASGWTPLLDGGLTRFDRVGAGNWRVEEGAAVANRGVGYLVTKQDYADFELRVEFWADAGTNSGIFIRCADRVKITAANCYEVNIWDQRPEPKYGTGAIVDVATVSPMPKAAGRWNTFLITAKGDHLTVTLNGQKTVDVRHPKHSRGPIALQQAQGVVKDSGDSIKFRKLEIRPL